MNEINAHAGEKGIILLSEKFHEHFYSSISSNVWWRALKRTMRTKSIDVAATTIFTKFHWRHFDKQCGNLRDRQIHLFAIDSCTFLGNLKGVK